MQVRGVAQAEDPDEDVPEPPRDRRDRRRIGLRVGEVDRHRPRPDLDRRRPGPTRPDVPASGHRLPEVLVVAEALEAWGLAFYATPSTDAALSNLPADQAGSGSGMVSLGINLIFTILAILSIVMTVPKGGGSRDLGEVAGPPTPEPQPTPDEEKAAVLRRLSTLSIAELELVEKQAMLQELGRLDPAVLQRLVAK